MGFGYKVLLLSLFMLMPSYAVGLGNSYDYPSEFILTPNEVKDYGVRITNEQPYPITVTVTINDKNKGTTLIDNNVFNLDVAERKSLNFKIQCPSTAINGTVNKITFTFNVEQLNVEPNEDGMVSSLVGAIIPVSYTVNSNNLVTDETPLPDETPLIDDVPIDLSDEAGEPLEDTLINDVDDIDTEPIDTEPAFVSDQLVNVTHSVNGITSTNQENIITLIRDNLLWVFGIIILLIGGMVFVHFSMFNKNKIEPKDNEPIIRTNNKPKKEVKEKVTNEPKYNLR